jgi:hypothetical protein
LVNACRLKQFLSLRISGTTTNEKKVELTAGVLEETGRKKNIKGSTALFHLHSGVVNL